jgi:hypothetical protein
MGQICHANVFVCYFSKNLNHSEVNKITWIRMMLKIRQRLWFGFVE